jgi:hypothetical protein
LEDFKKSNNGIIPSLMFFLFNFVMTLAQPHNECKVQNYELFFQVPHLDVPFDNKEVKLICALVLFCFFSTYLVFVLFHTLEHQNFIIASDLVIPPQLSIKV